MGEIGIVVGGTIFVIGVHYRMLPLKPAPEAVQDNTVRSLCPAAIATGLAVIDRGIRQGLDAARSRTRWGSIALWEWWEASARVRP